MPLILMVVLTCTSLVDIACAAGPMPYTEEALARLNCAMEKIKSPPPVTSGDDERSLKLYIANYKAMFSAAGFDYERSMIRIINDIQFDRYKLNRTTIKLNGLARELMRAHVKSGVHPGKYLSKDCAELLIEFRKLIRSNMEKYGGC